MNKPPKRYIMSIHNIPIFLPSSFWFHEGQGTRRLLDGKALLPGGTWIISAGYFSCVAQQQCSITLRRKSENISVGRLASYSCCKDSQISVDIWQFWVGPSSTHFLKSFSSSHPFNNCLPRAFYISGAVLKAKLFQNGHNNYVSCIRLIPR